MVTLFIASLVVWIFIRVLSHIRLNRYLRRIGYPNLRRSKALCFFSAHRERKLIGRTWLLRYSQYAILAAVIVLFLMAIYRATITGHALELARSGALITVGGLTSLLIGFLEDKKIDSDWDIILGATGPEAIAVSLDNLMADSKDSAQRRVQITAFLVSMFGTFIWAFGDQILACGAFPHFNIADQSAVTCFSVKK